MSYSCHCVCLQRTSVLPFVVAGVAKHWSQSSRRVCGRLLTSALSFFVSFSYHLAPQRRRTTPSTRLLDSHYRADHELFPHHSLFLAQKHFLTRAAGQRRQHTPTFLLPTCDLRPLPIRIDAIGGDTSVRNCIGGLAMGDIEILMRWIESRWRPIWVRSF